MPRITKVTTRAGDDGTTTLASGHRVSKASPRIAAIGALDELNGQLGVVLAAGVSGKLVQPLIKMQNDLFHAGAELAMPVAHRVKMAGPRIEARHIRRLDRLIERLGKQLPPLPNFLLPGGTPAAAHLQVARAICRRAERQVVALGEREPVGAALVRYLNRLSDALFLMARYENQQAGAAERVWDSRV